MTEQPTIGTVFEQDGFRGEIIGFVSGLMVTDGKLEGALAAHASDRDEFAVVIEGEVLVAIDGRHSTLTAGQSIIVPAGKTHEVTALRTAKLLLIG